VTGTLQNSVPVTICSKFPRFDIFTERRMIHVILTTLRKLRPVNVPLGRWSRTEKIHNDIKVDWANMDHCGTCAKDKMDDVDLVTKKDVTNPSDMYLKKY
jgi:hypothetical protein